MMNLNLVRAVPLARACSDRDVSRCSRVVALNLRGVTPAHDVPFALADGRGRVLRLIQLDRPTPVFGYRAVGSHK